mmetsp:Transcript_10489/g.10543  ORF Transcript_10489/g.10543 Transcript_10489/m.10543 type:complete len:285 (+) Transcript_10489:931-1785(+)
MKEFVYSQHNMIQKIAFQFQNSVQVLTSEECKQLYSQKKKVTTELQSASEKEIRISTFESKLSEEKKKSKRNPQVNSAQVHPAQANCVSRNGVMGKEKSGLKNQRSEKKHRSPDDLKPKVGQKQVLIQKKNQQVLKAASQTRAQKNMSATQRSKSKSSSSEDGRQFFIYKKPQEILQKQPSEPVQASFVQAFESSRTSIGPKRLKSPGPSPVRLDSQNNSSKKCGFNQSLLLKGKSFASSPKNQIARGPQKGVFQGKQMVSKLKSSFEQMPAHPMKMISRKNKS